MTQICTECHVGSPHVETVTWARLEGRHLVVVPDIEALVCDVCGAIEYDFETIGRLEMLLLVGASSGQRPRMGPSVIVPRGAWASDRPIRAV